MIQCEFHFMFGRNGIHVNWIGNCRFFCAALALCCALSRYLVHWVMPEKFKYWPNKRANCFIRSENQMQLWFLMTTAFHQIKCALLVSLKLPTLKSALCGCRKGERVNMKEWWTVFQLHFRWKQCGQREHKIDVQKEWENGWRLST